MNEREQIGRFFPEAGKYPFTHLGTSYMASVCVVVFSIPLIYGQLELWKCSWLNELLEILFWFLLMILAVLWHYFVWFFKEDQGRFKVLPLALLGGVCVVFGIVDAWSKERELEGVVSRGHLVYAANLYLKDDGSCVVQEIEVSNDCCHICSYQRDGDTLHFEGIPALHHGGKLWPIYIRDTNSGVWVAVDSAFTPMSAETELTLSNLGAWK